jgi:hypothetical protein
MEIGKNVLILALVIIIVIAGIFLISSVDKINNLAALVNVRPYGVKEEVNFFLLASVLAVAVIVISVIVLTLLLSKK